MKLMKPLRSGLQSVFILVFTVLLVLISAECVRLFPQHSLFFRLVGAVSLALGAALECRYCLTEYIYAVDGNVFSVRRRLGFYERTVFSRELKRTDRLLSKAEFKKTKRKAQSYRQNLTAVCAYLVFDKDAVEFEPNEAFYSIIKKALENLNE